MGLLRLFSDHWRTCKLSRCLWKSGGADKHVRSRVAIKMSRASEKAKDGDEGKADSAGTLSEEEEGDNIDDDAPRDETPDLYRNSSLGMYVF